MFPERVIVFRSENLIVGVMEIHHITSRFRSCSHNTSSPCSTRNMDDSLPLNTASVARVLQQLRVSPEAHGSRRDPRVPPAVSRFLSRSKPETCQFLGPQDIRGCRQPRSCRNCIHRDGCVVAAVGCASDGWYSSAFDYKRIGIDGTGFSVFEDVATIDRAHSNGPSCYYSNASHAMFPTITTGYCSGSDPVCPKCPDSTDTVTIYINVSDRVGGHQGQRLFCLRTDSCVCVAAYEDPPASSESASLSHCRFATTRGDAIPNSTVATFVLGLAFLILLAYWYTMETSDTNNRDDRDPTASHSFFNSARGVRRYMLDVAPALHLDLYGWRHFQNEILRKEQQLLSGAGDVSPVVRPMAFEFAAIPTAPDLDEEEESTAPTMTNPHALASAPVFRLRTPGATVDEDLPQDPSVPSAPEF